MAYGAFGEINTAVNGSGFYDFTGQQQWTVPGTSGIDDFPFRKYSPVQGRWVSPDPAGMAAVDISNPQTWNRYAYLANNPLNAVDPKGLYKYCPNADGCNWDANESGAGDYWWGSGEFDVLSLPVYEEGYTPAVPLSTPIDSMQNENGYATSAQLSIPGGWGLTYLGSGINFLPVGSILSPGMNGQFQAAANAAKNFMRKPIRNPNLLEDPWTSQEPLSWEDVLNEESLTIQKALDNIADFLDGVKGGPAIFMFNPNIFGCAGAQGLPCNDPTSVFYNNGNKPTEF